MGALAVKASTMEAPASKHKAEPTSLRTAARSATISSPFPVPIIQRKAACACGGDCPRCADDSPLQAKADIDAPNDPLELEADRAAEQVMSVSAPSRTMQPAAPLPGFTRQRKRERDETPTSLPSTANERPEMSALPESVRETLDAAGQPLDVATRGFMETRFGHDFGHVRIHADGKAAESAQAVNALAYTVGRNIVFGAGQYEPGTSRGDRLIAHELAHTIQQSGSHALSPTGAAHPLISSFKGARLSRLKDQSCKPPLSTSAEKIRCHIIENKPPASDAKATEEWKKGLRAIFEGVAATEAKELHDRLSPGAKGDAFSQFFQQQVDSATRDEMLDILKKKFAAPTTPTPPPTSPTPTTPTPTAPAAADTPILSNFVFKELHPPIAKVDTGKEDKEEPDEPSLFTVENPTIDCGMAFIAVIEVKANHVGRIFFRQYLMSLVRKENACGRGPMGVDKGPALDTKEVYNNQAKDKITGVMSATGKDEKIMMVDLDAPLQNVENPCSFKEGDAVGLYAADKFRLYVMWEPKGGSPVPLGYKEWRWQANGLFKKQAANNWTKLLTDTDGPKDLSGAIVKGDVPTTTETITGPTIMKGKKSVPEF